MVNVDKAGLKELYPPSFVRWLAAVASDWAVIAITLGVVDRIHDLPHKVIAWVVGSWVIGTRQQAIAILGHEGAHGLVSRDRWLNDWATRLLCFCPVGVDLAGYREFHRKHHQASGGPDDPEILFKRLEGKWDLPMDGRRLAGYCLADLLGAGAPYAVGLAVNLHPRDLRGWLALAAWWAAAIGVSARCGCSWVLGLWAFAFVTSFWCVFRLRMMTEHLGTPTTHRLSANWWQRAIFLPHGTWLHDVHHANQNVPCHRLEAALAFYPDLVDRKTVGELLGEVSRHGSASPGDAEFRRWTRGR